MYKRNHLYTKSKIIFWIFQKIFTTSGARWYNSERLLKFYIRAAHLMIFLRNFRIPLIYKLRYIFDDQIITSFALKTDLLMHFCHCGQFSTSMTILLSLILINPSQFNANIRPCLPTQKKWFLKHLDSFTMYGFWRNEPPDGASDPFWQYF